MEMRRFPRRSGIASPGAMEENPSGRLYDSALNPQMFLEEKAKRIKYIPRNFDKDDISVISLEYEVSIE